jgi:hypothetical protein
MGQRTGGGQSDGFMNRTASGALPRTLSPAVRWAARKFQIFLVSFRCTRLHGNETIFRRGASRQLITKIEQLPSRFVPTIQMLVALHIWFISLAVNWPLHTTQTRTCCGKSRRVSVDNQRISLTFRTAPLCCGLKEEPETTPQRGKWSQARKRSNPRAGNVNVKAR